LARWNLERRLSHEKDEKKRTRRTGAFRASLRGICLGGIYGHGFVRNHRPACACSGGGEPRSHGGAQRGSENARWGDAACGCLPAEGGGKISRATGAHAVRQEERDEFWDEGGGTRLRGDCSGRARAFDSEGEWYTFKNESQDGYDTVEWAATLPYSNGKVGMFGGSYVGATQFLAALAKPPHLAGICPTVTASNYHDGWTYQGGAFEQWFNESWSTGLAENTMRRRLEKNADALGGTKVLPLISYPVLEPPSGDGIAPYFKDWLAHPNFDEYWKQWSIEDHYAQIEVPVLNIAAWYDIFLGGSLKNYVRLKTDGGTEAARKGQRLVVTVGGHAGQSSTGKVGGVEFGSKLQLGHG